MNIILYASQYGTARKYAEALSNRTGYEVKSYQDVNDIRAYETIVYIGALYAGSVMGLKKTFRGLSDCAQHRIIIATVGLADPDDRAYTNTVRNGMKNQLSSEVYEKASIHHLRGGIDYSRLGLKHRAMIRLLHKAAVNLPEEKRTAEIKAMIETYNQQVDFTDLERLNPIIQELTRPGM